MREIHDHYHILKRSFSTFIHQKKRHYFIIKFQKQILK